MAHMQTHTCECMGQMEESSVEIFEPTYSQDSLCQSQTPFLLVPLGVSSLLSSNILLRKVTLAIHGVDYLVKMLNPP